MGGRGASFSEKTSVKSSSGAKQKVHEDESKKKIPMYGEKVQSAYIDYVKNQTGIDLTSHRDTYFDNRKGFNIDTRNLTFNQISAIKRLADKYPGGYEVSFMSNGDQRIFVSVKRKKR